MSIIWLILLINPLNLSLVLYMYSQGPSLGIDTKLLKRMKKGIFIKNFFLINFYFFYFCRLSILDDYLKTVLTSNFEYKDLEEANMYYINFINKFFIRYLAEDRILCLKIYSRKNKKYYLAYLPDAYAEVDPITNLINLMG